MSGIGPLEPGEGTTAQDNSHTVHLRSPGRRRAALAVRYARHRRLTLCLAALAVLLAGGGYLYGTRPRQPHPAPTPQPSQAPYPAQVVDVTYLEDLPAAAGAPPRSFRFGVLVGVDSGPPVTVTRVTQPYAGLTLSTDPAAPFRTRAGSARMITITMHVTECGKVPKDAGMPFLDVTLRNTRAIQNHSFILGPRYAQHLSQALKVACSNSVE